jgi:hypothetical protein
MRMKAPAGFVVGFLGMVVVGVGVLSQGCGGGGGKSCDVGSESCPCTSGNICNSGLTCVSKTCVNLSGGAGSDGGAGGTTGTAGTSGSIDTACASFDAICQKLNTCAPALVKFNYGTVDECVKRFKISCLDASKAPDSGLTAATISACAAALPAATCEDAIYRKVTACEVKGGRSNGMACGTNEQCSTGHCAQADQACGVCAAFVGAGAACSVDEDCEPGLLCSNDSHCVVPGTAGGVCNTNQPCRLGLYCRNGSCVNGAETPGTTCEPTLTASCDLLKGIYCDSTVGKCANLGFAANGDPCGLVAAKFVSCAAGECIYPTADATQGVCGALAGDGAACDATTLCESPARCLSGHCKLPSSSACL